MSSNAPSITISRLDFERIEELLESPLHRNAATANLLRAELERATVVEPDQVPADVVSMNSVVSVQDETDGTTRELTLVYPHKAAAVPGEVSVFAPVGVALLGLRIGQSIEWPMPAGNRRLAIRGISYQPESSGHFHR